VQTFSDFEVVESPSRRWKRVDTAAKISGIPRSRLFEMIKEGQIRPATIRHKGKRRGIRMIDMISLDVLLQRDSKLWPGAKSTKAN
jgi:hypothetical protein